MPEIIFTDNPSNNLLNQGRIITVTSRQFINLIKYKDIKTVFSGYEPNHKIIDFFLYVLKNGFIINASTEEIEYLEDYFRVQKEGLSDFYEYLEYLYYDVNTIMEYYKKFIYFSKTNVELFRDFKKSSFFGFRKKHFETYLDAKLKGFDVKRDYEYATSLGIKNKKDFEKFLESKKE